MFCGKTGIRLLLYISMGIALFISTARGEIPDAGRAEGRALPEKRAGDIAPGEGGPERSPEVPGGEFPAEGRGDQMPAPKKIKIRIFFFGNSYTSYNDLPNTFARVCRQLSPPFVEFQVSSFAPGGFWWSQHLKTLTDPATALYQTFSSQKWDWAVLQEQSQIPGLDPTDPYYVKSRTALKNLVQILQKKGIKPILLMTWGRRDGDKLNPHLYPNFSTMQRRLEEGYLRYSKLFSPPLFVAPAGSVWKKIYEALKSKGTDPLKKNSLFHRLYFPDGSHPSAIGTFAAALTLCNALFGFDSSLQKNFSVPSALGLSPSERNLLLSAVRDVTFGNPFGKFRFYWSRRWNQFRAPPSTAPPRQKSLPLPTTTPVVSHYLYLPAVGIDSPLSLKNLAVGGLHTLPKGLNPTEFPGGGRLFILPGARVNVGGTVLLRGSPLAELNVLGGILSTSKIISIDSVGISSIFIQKGSVKVSDIDVSGGRSKLILSGGLLEVKRVKGNLIQEGGGLSVEKKLRVEGDILQRGGELSVNLQWGKGQVPVISVSGRAVLLGKVGLRFSGAVGKTGEELRLVLVEAGKILLNKGFSIAVYPGTGEFFTEYKIVKSGSKEQLEVTVKVLRKEGERERTAENSPKERGSSDEIERERGEEKIGDGANREGIVEGSSERETPADGEEGFADGPPEGQRGEVAVGCCNFGGPDFFGLLIILWFFAGLYSKKVEYFLPPK